MVEIVGNQKVLSTGECSFLFIAYIMAYTLGYVLRNSKFVTDILFDNELQILKNWQM